ncbi:putative methylthiotransferase [Dioscorea sansibarensis]
MLGMGNCVRPGELQSSFSSTHVPLGDNAEQKVWQRLNYFWFLKREWKSNVATGRSQSKHPPKIVVLGCMAERLKDKILAADKMVDVVCGPDAYRDLPPIY